MKKRNKAFSIFLFQITACAILVFSAARLMVSQVGEGLTIPENPLKGSQIFIDKGCFACHMVMSVGEVLGPDLTTIGREKNFYGLAGALWSHSPKMLEIMKENNIQHLPVMKNGDLVGIVTDRDLKRASASDATSLESHELFYLLSKITMEEIMTKDPITVPPDFTVEETAKVLMEKKISGVPVVDAQGKLLGIITLHDIFRVLMSLTGGESRDPRNDSTALHG